MVAPRHVYPALVSGLFITELPWEPSVGFYFGVVGEEEGEGRQDYEYSFEKERGNLQNREIHLFHNVVLEPL